MRKRGTRVRVCTDCGREEEVHADNKASVCYPCSSREKAKAFLLPKIAPAATVKCQQCGLVFKRSSSQQRELNFCSISCRSAHFAVERRCKTCQKPFRLTKGRVNGKSNSAGNFCCRPCYETWLCRTDRTAGRGSQWKKARDEALRSFPFCAACGTPNELQVHHIIPFRITHDNGQENLIPLCRKHHKTIECAFVEFEAAQGEITPAVSIVWRSMLAEMKARTAVKIKEIIGD